jgi:large subunit ribosomal protein L15e
MYKYVRKSFALSFKTRSDAFKQRLAKWRRENTVVRAEGPTNPVRARELGYRATKDFIIARVRVKRGKRVRDRSRLGRKPGKNRKRVNPGRELSYYAEQKVKRDFTNLDVVGSYLVGEDGINKYFEVILVNPYDTSPRNPAPKAQEPKAAQAAQQAEKAKPAAASKK